MKKLKIKKHPKIIKICYGFELLLGISMSAKLYCFCWVPNTPKLVLYLLAIITMVSFIIVIIILTVLVLKEKSSEQKSLESNVLDDCFIENH
jgi:predicted tellurium resistance membrane protein TerC